MLLRVVTSYLIPEIACAVAGSRRSWVCLNRPNDPRRSQASQTRVCTMPSTAFVPLSGVRVGFPVVTEPYRTLSRLISWTHHSGSRPQETAEVDHLISPL